MTATDKPKKKRTPRARVAPTDAAQALAASVGGAIGEAASPVPSGTPRIPSDDPKAEVGSFERPPPPAWTPRTRAEWVAESLERAAIMEYDGEMSRPDAERAARACVGPCPEHLR